MQPRNVDLRDTSSAWPLDRSPLRSGVWRIPNREQADLDAIEAPVKSVMPAWKSRYGIAQPILGSSDLTGTYEPLASPVLRCGSLSPAARIQGARSAGAAPNRVLFRCGSHKGGKGDVRRP